MHAWCVRVNINATRCRPLQSLRAEFGRGHGSGDGRDLRLTCLKPFRRYCCRAAVTNPRVHQGSSLFRQILPANEHVLEVEPRGFEPLTSAVQRRLDGFPKVSRDCKTRLATRILAQNAFPHFSSHRLGLLHKRQWQLRRNTLWPVRPAAADRGDRNGKPGKPCERNAHGHAMSNSITIH